MRYFSMICLTCMSFAETLYVDTNGNDTSGDGSSTFPWATITHALDNATDGDLILVRPGTYYGRIRLRGVFNIGVTVRSEIPYRAHLRHDGTAITCFYGIGITVEGFDISHSSPGSEALVIQIQDLRGTAPGGADATSFITFIDNPELASTASLVLPYWNSATEQFNSGSLRVSEEFLRLVENYAAIPETAPTIDMARLDQSPATDILGTPRSSQPDIGAFEYSPCQSVFNLDQNPDIDILDLYVILEFWRTENHVGFDANPIVDIIDFIQLINAFGPCTP